MFDILKVAAMSSKLFLGDPEAEEVTGLTNEELGAFTVEVEMSKTNNEVKKAATFHLDEPNLDGPPNQDEDEKSKFYGNKENIDKAENLLNHYYASIGVKDSEDLMRSFYRYSEEETIEKYVKVEGISDTQLKERWYCTINDCQFLIDYCEWQESLNDKRADDVIERGKSRGFGIDSDKANAYRDDANSYRNLKLFYEKALAYLEGKFMEENAQIFAAELAAKKKEFESQVIGKCTMEETFEKILANPAYQDEDPKKYFTSNELNQEVFAGFSPEVQQAILDMHLGMEVKVKGSKVKIYLILGTDDEGKERKKEFINNRYSDYELYITVKEGYGEVLTKSSMINGERYILEIREEDGVITPWVGKQKGKSVNKNIDNGGNW